MDHTDLVQQALARYVSRRWFLRDCGLGLAGIAAGALASRQSDAAPQADNPMAVRQPHFPPKAKRVIYMYCCNTIPISNS